MKMLQKRANRDKMLLWSENAVEIRSPGGKGHQVVRALKKKNVSHLYLFQLSHRILPTVGGSARHLPAAPGTHGNKFIFFK
jgi:hypothetical protein